MKRLVAISSLYAGVAHVQQFRKPAASSLSRSVRARALLRHASPRGLQIMPINPHDAIIGKTIRVHRLARHMSQQDLGKRLGVSFQQIQKYEKGASQVTASRLFTIATLLKVPVVTFFGPVKSVSLHNSPFELLTRRDAFELAEAYDKISSRRLRKSILALVQKLV